MSDERMKILKMLEEGKISAEDAAKLLATVSASPAKAEKSSADGNRQQYSDKRTEGFGDDWSRKFDGFMKDFEPKLRDISVRVVEQTAKVADSISKSVASSSVSRPVDRGSVSVEKPSGASEKSFEIKVGSSGSFLNLSAQNGSILLKGYNGDKITAKVYYKAKRGDAAISLMALGNKFYMNYDEDLFERVSVDAYVPYNMFSHINLNAVNGGISGSGLECGELSAINSNSELSLKDIKAERIIIDAQNAREIKLSELISRSAEIECSNGAIFMHENDIENLKLVSFNSTIDFSISKLVKFNDYLWILETSNQKLQLFLPTVSHIGYYLKAQSSLGVIRIGLTGLNYIFSDKNNTEAKSINYDSAEKRVRISLETSNAQLVVN